MSSGQDNQLETGLANQGGRLTGSSKFKQQSAVGDAFSSHRLGGSRFRIFPGFLGGDSSSTVVPVNALDLTVLYAKTDAFGQTITPAEWQTDRDPLFIWAPPIAADNVAGYSYAIDGAPDDIADTVATSLNVATATLADRIIAGRPYGDQRQKGRGIGDLLLGMVLGSDEEEKLEVFRRLAHLLTTRSDVFQILSLGQTAADGTPGASQRITAVVQR